MVVLWRQIKDHLFDDTVIGIDLIAINMQRGRDHGLPGYIQYRRICNPGEAYNDFEDLRSDMTQEVKIFLILFIIGIVPTIVLIVTIEYITIFSCFKLESIRPIIY